MPQNRVNLGKKPSNDLYSTANSRFDDVSGTTYPIWRLRIVAGGSTRYVRFDTATSPPGQDDIVDPIVTTGSLTLKLSVDSSVTVLSGATIVTGSAGDPGAVTLNVAGSGRILPNLRILGTATTATLFLERLSDPTQALTPAGSIAGTAVTGSAVWFGTAATTTPVRYMVVDKATIQVNETSLATNFTGTRSGRSTTNPTNAFWRIPAAPTPVTALNGETLTLPGPVSTGNTAWFVWPNRPFTSSAELFLVPQGNAVDILENYTRLSPARSGAVGLGRGIPAPPQLLLDAVHVPTRFAAIHRTFTQNHSNSAGIDNSITTVNQLSSFREPGRVNLNTVGSDDVWNAVVAGQLPGPITTRTAAGFSVSPATNLASMLSLSGGGGMVASDTSSPALAVNLNPLHEIYTATRLANTTTPRSNVFAIWITVRESVPNDPDSVKFRRAFYIVDRSIPVAYEDGNDHNVWNCVRLRRIIE
jgi:hypothetical protein